MVKSNLQIQLVSVGDLKPSDYNPRKWTETQKQNLKKSIQSFGIVDPFIVNSAKNRENVLVGGHFRLATVKELGFTEVPCVYVNIPDIEREKELNLRLNSNQGEWDWNLLAEFDEKLLANVGFTSEEIDQVFPAEEMPEKFDLDKELKKLKIDSIKVQNGDRYQLGDHILMCGNSTVEEDVLKLMGGEKADMCFTDPPYILAYNSGKRRSKSTEGFGYKRDRKYIGTDELPHNFSDLWMANVAKIQKSDFSIIIFENPKNLRTIWNALEVHWKYRNTIIWHLPNRTQGFAAKYKFFNKYDFAMLGTSGQITLNDDPENDPLLQEEYETALFATSGKPHWESYEKGKKYCPSDFIEFKADDSKHSGQGIIFGTKPLEVLIPYMKVLTKRGDIVLEPFGGSGSTLIAAEKLKRRCFIMEKCPIYAEVIMKRWENLTSLNRKKL